MPRHKFTIFKDKKQFTMIGLNIGMIAVVAGLCIVSNRIYKNSGDWSRTLWYDYDFTGENKKIHNLYIGSCGDLYLTDKESEDFPERENDCNLMSSEQNMEESYYLLRKADRRYDLSHVFLGLDCWFSVYEIKKSDLSCIGEIIVERDKLTEKEEEYFRKMIAYCKENRLELVINIFLFEETEEEMQVQKQNALIDQIGRIAQEYGGVEYHVIGADEESRF